MEETLPQSPYKILGVPKDATLSTIRSAHRKLVLQCHPDKVQDEAEKKIKAEQFHHVQQAYEILSDETRRQKFDDKARLADLRAEVHPERGPPPRRPTEYTTSRASYSAGFEVRGGRVYEERAPKNSRAYQEDDFVAGFADYRPSARKYDEMFTESPRRFSGRMQEDKRRAREAEMEQDRKVRESVRKAEEASIREERDRRRAKERKKDVEAKSRRGFTFVEAESDSEADERRRRDSTPPRRRQDDLRRRDREEPKRGAKRDVRGYRDEDDMDSKVSGAQDYISRHRDAYREAEAEPRNRPGRPRASSDLNHPPPTAPPPPPHRPVDNRRRSSDRERSDKERSGGEKDKRRARPNRGPSPIRTNSGKKDKKTEATPSRKPPLSSFTSDPKGLKNPVSSKKEPLRTATASYPSSPDFKHPPMRRAETMPIHPKSRMDQQPIRSSGLRNTKAASDDSDSDSDTSTESDSSTEVGPSPIPTSSKKSFKVNLGNESSPQVVYEEPEEIYPRAREASPKTTRRATDRPSLGRETSSSIRTPPTRGSSFTGPDDRPSSRRKDSGRVPPLNVHSSSRGDKLYGEYSSTDEIHRSPRSPKSPPLDGRGSKTHTRRGSEDVERDANPYSYQKSNRRPSYQRGEPVY